METTKRAISYKKNGFSDDLLLDLYKAILKPRMIEEKMLSLLRQGKVSKWFSGIGQEAISVGATKALQMQEYVFTMHRNLGVFTCRDVPLAKLFAQLQGKKSGFSKGRERSFHFGTNEHHIIGMISHVAAMLPVADGIALADLLSDKKNVTLVLAGEGATSEGDFHEALNVAAVWDLPVIFLIENNGYALSTPVKEQFRIDSIAQKAEGYGIEGISIDGNNILEVYQTVSRIAEKMRSKPAPVLLECMTFRMKGHEEASGTKYVPKQLQEEWARKDPIHNYEQWLIEEGILNEDEKNKISDLFKKEIIDAIEIAFSEGIVEVDQEEEIKDISAPFEQKIINPKTEKKSEKRFVDALSDGLSQSLEKHPNLIIMGQDIAEYGGVFKVTEGFLEKFGKDRIRNTALCESGIVGAGLGLSIKGYKSVIEMQFADFVTCGFNQIVNNLAKIHYRWGQNADVVIRMPTGAGVGAGPFHSQSNEAWFFHVPGLKIVYPATPSDAKGLIMAAIDDPNPILYFEHKAIYRSVSENVYDDPFTTMIGKARLLTEGKDVSIITYGMGVHWAKETLKELNEINADLIDLMTLLPFDKEAIEKTVKKTGKVIILHEDTLTGGIGAEISAFISENFFEHLDGPVIRSASLDSPIPFAEPLEQNFLPKERFKKQLKELVGY